MHKKKKKEAAAYRYSTCASSEHFYRTADSVKVAGISRGQLVQPTCSAEHQDQVAQDHSQTDNFWTSQDENSSTSLATTVRA